MMKNDVPIGKNRTGIALSPIDKREMLEVTDLTRTSAEDDASGLEQDDAGAGIAPLGQHGRPESRVAATDDSEVRRMPPAQRRVVVAAGVLQPEDGMLRGG